jgi:thiaminase/transcriptional activator TenA
VLLRTATTAEFAEVLAALLPCMWGYSELGRALAACCAALLDRAADGLPAARLAACERAFLTSLRHQLAFWDA